MHTYVYIPRFTQNMKCQFMYLNPRKYTYYCYQYSQNVLFKYAISIT